jgi:ketosteroid isomerase-like protein
MKKLIITTLVIFNLITLTAHSQQQQSNMKTTENQAIISTIQNIFEGADQRDWKKIEGSFAPEVLVDYTSLAGGSPASASPEQIVSAWKNLLPGFQSTHHQIGNFAIEHVNPSSANAKFHGLAVHYLPLESGESFWTVVGTYDYHLVKLNDVWKADRIKFNLQKQHGNVELAKLAQGNVKDGVQFAKHAASQEARTVVAKFFAALERLDINAFLKVWAPKGKQVMPLAPEGFPSLLEGKEAIYNQYKSLPENFNAMSFPYKIVNTEDPNKVIVQYTGYIPLKDGGEYNNNYVGVFEIENGLLVRFTEFFDPFILENAFGAKLESNFNVEK